MGRPQEHQAEKLAATSRTMGFQAVDLHQTEPDASVLKLRSFLEWPTASFNMAEASPLEQTNTAPFWPTAKFNSKHVG